MAKNRTTKAPSPKDNKIPAQTTVEPFVDRALAHARGAATPAGIVRFILTEWAKKNPAPQDAHLFRN